MRVTSVFLFLMTIVISNCQVEYYEELITNEINRISNLSFKTDNSEFWKNNVSNKTHNFGQYDFIIIGAGAAGAVVANRLSEVRKWKILVIEAGKDENDFTDIPAVWLWTAISDRAWNYYTTPQTTYCLGMNNKQCYLPGGKSVGGTSSLGGSLQSRGNQRDFDRWVKVHHNSGWSYRHVLPYFKKFENFTVEGDPGYHGYSGPVSVSYGKPNHNLSIVFRNAHQEMGLDFIDDAGARQIGVSAAQKYLKNNKRASSGRAYIDPARNRKNFKITTDSYVTKILINNYKRAYGVIFMKNGKKYRATARKEVILSAGVINSPQILMLSGIGPEKHLRNLGIKVIKNLPVGQKLYDHISYMLYLNSDFIDRTQTVKEQIEDFLNGYGSLVNENESGFTSFYNKDTFYEKIPTYCNKNSIPTVSTSTHSPTLKFLNYRNDVLYGLYGDANPQQMFGLLVILLHPKSVGTISLKSKNPIDFPNLNVNALSDECDEDITNLYEGIKFAKQVLQTEAFSKINTQIKNYTISECTDHEYDSKDYWFCMIRHLAYPGYHLIGTTRMGWNDDNYVVDDRLRVYGIKDLRVVDAGIMPEPNSGSPLPVVFMIGEKAADLIKQDNL